MPVSRIASGQKAFKLPFLRIKNQLMSPHQSQASSKDSRIYFDNAATTSLDQVVLEELEGARGLQWGYVAVVAEVGVECPARR